MPLLLLFLAFILTACSGSPVKPPESAGTLRAPLIGDPTTFNPAIARTGSSLEIARLLFVGLLAPAADGQFQPELARNFQVAEGGRRFRVTLRENLFWSDGERLTSDDVVFTFKQYRGEGAPLRLPAGLAVEAVDATTVEWRLAVTDPGFVAYLSLPILPAHAFKNGQAPLEAWGLDVDPTSLPVSGPFFCSRSVVGEKLVLTANPRYWRRPDAPHLAQIEYTIFPDRSAARARLESGGLDTYRLVPEDYAALEAGQSRGDYALVSGGPEPDPVFLSFNLNRGRRGKEPLVDPVASSWFNDAAFRQAIATALDRQTMVREAWLNTAVAAEHPYDLEAAKSGLQKAGFRPGSTGQLLDSGGNPVHFTLFTDADQPQHLATARRVEADLQALGIEVEVRPLPRLSLRNRVLGTGVWQAVLTSLPALGLNPVESGSVWRSDSPWHFFNRRSGLKGERASDWEVQLDEIATGSEDLTERRQLIEAQQPLIELVRPLMLAAVHSGVTGGRVSALESEYYGRVFGNIWAVQAPAISHEPAPSTP